MSKLSDELAKKMLESFESNRTLSKVVRGFDDANMKKFKCHTVTIPWYLRLFAKEINSIAYSSFRDGLSYSKQDVVKFKRPAPYSEDKS